MANITILEQDLTTAGSSSVVDNVVYIPGYATKGPVNEPTLCNTLAEFQSIFGTVPYKFKNIQQYSGKTYAVKNDYEKSYFYAADIVNSGLPIMFERVALKDAQYAESSETFVALKSVTSAVATQNDVIKHITLSKSGEKYTYTDASENSFFKGLYKQTENGKFNIQTSTVSIDFTYGEGYTAKATLIGSDETTFNVSEIQLIDNSLVFKIDTNLETEATLTYSLENPIYYQVKNAYVDGKNKYKAYFSLNRDNVNSELSSGTVIVADDGGFIITNDDIDFTSVKLARVDAGKSISTNLKAKVTAKYPGQYGQNIAYSISGPRAVSGIDYYEVTVTDYTDTKEDQEVITICFDNRDNDNFYKNVNPRLINIEFDSLDDLLQEPDLIALSGLDVEIPLIYSGEADEDEFTVEGFYNVLTTHDDIESIFEKLVDRGEYNIKFITSGGYPSFITSGEKAGTDVAVTMLTVAGNRGDVVALIDHDESAKSEDVYNLINNTNANGLNRKMTTSLGEDIQKYGAMFTPWSKYQIVSANEIIALPASYGYLRCLAASTKTNANWYAVSGVTRGQVPSLLEEMPKVTGAVADKLQSRTGVSINPITNIRPYGYCIWGNRTLYNTAKDLVASSFLNIRMLTNDVKKVVYAAAKELTFELNDNILWLNFKAKIEPTLEQMKSGNGLSGYKITKLPTTKKATIVCKITLYAVEAVEDWDITVELADNYVSVQ